MNSAKHLSQLLGLAFLLQFITSVASGMALQPALIVPGDINETLVRIATNPELMRLYIFVDMLTAMGIVFLGAMLFVTLRKENENMALVGLGLYILEAGLLAASRMGAFSLLRISEDYVTAGRPENLQTMGAMTLEAMDAVGFLLHMLAFGAGAILFYILLYRSRVVPRALSLWGLITLLPLVFGTVIAMFDIEVPALLYMLQIPYIPFEFVIGLWILVKGLDVPQQDRLTLEPA
jgi:hypothetical protein